MLGRPDLLSGQTEHEFATQLCSALNWSPHESLFPSLGALFKRHLVIVDLLELWFYLRRGELHTAIQSHTRVLPFEALL